jgi:cytochrome d ubiquinol oxidase subunit II
MDLQTLWFVVVAVFWTGFFVLEGFDFGVGALHRLVGKDETERRVAINAIGLLWTATRVDRCRRGEFAFSAWYATWFSALYLALVLVLVALIIRGVSFEFRGTIARWRPPEHHPDRSVPHRCSSASARRPARGPDRRGGRVHGA